MEISQQLYRDHDCLFQRIVSYNLFSAQLREKRERFDEISAQMNMSFN